jgi:nucleotide-binding universal stress UspA family protein
MKNVLLLVHDDEGQEARLRAALDVVRAVEGHLTCLDVIVYPLFVGDDDYGAVGMLLQDERQTEGKNRLLLEPRIVAEGLPFDWVERTGSFSECLVEAAALADLIVVNRKLDAAFGPDMRGIASNVLLEAKKPILAVPEAIRPLDIKGHAFVAWDGSAVAIDALRAAIPLLDLARRVTILEVKQGDITTSAEDAATYLARNDILSDVLIVQPRDGSAATEILREIGLHKPDYLVMGGFGHSRLREALLGGVTREMLTECPIPLFIVH